MIIKYRKYLYHPELSESDVWLIFNLDIEYGKFIANKQQIWKFLQKVATFNDEAKQYEEELKKARDQYELNFFSPLISFFKSYYQEELEKLEENDQKKKIPLKFDKIQNAKKYKLD